MMCAGLIPWVLVLSSGCWPHPKGAGLVPWVLVLCSECWSHLTSAGPTPLVLAPSHGCWPPTKAVGALTKAPAAECLESLKKVRIPPSSTVQEELQFFLGSRGGVTQGGSTALVPSAPPPPALPSPVVGDTGICLPEPLPSVHCLGPVEYPGFFEAFKLEDKAGRGCQACPLPFLVPGFGKVWLPLPRVLTFSSLSPSTGGTVLCQAKSPLSWLEPLLARSWRPPTGTWGGREGGSG